MVHPPKLSAIRGGGAHGKYEEGGQNHVAISPNREASVIYRGGKGI